MALSNYKGPAYLRLSRAPHPVIYGDDMKFEIEGNHSQDGSDIAIISTGTILHRVLEAADLLGRTEASMPPWWICIPLDP